MATHSSILAWRIQWTEDPGGLLSMGSLRIGHDRAIDTFTFHASFGPRPTGPCNKDRNVFALIKG